MYKGTFYRSTGQVSLACLNREKARVRETLRRAECYEEQGIGADVVGKSSSASVQCDIDPGFWVEMGEPRTVHR